MPRERILITVKTYPTLSRKYGETVCTAGVREDGSWVRICPVPFRRLEEPEQYRKFDWLECDLVRGHKDPRPESHHPSDMKQLMPVGHMDTADNCRERRRLLLGRAAVHTRLLAKVRQKYFTEFTRKDLHFFLGTTQGFHFRGPNPWVIVGVLPIPIERQGTLF
jgi:hypothetical protein